MAWTQGARRAVARAVMPKLFAQGYSANAGLKLFKAIGPGLQRQLWLKDWREITGAKKLERVYRFIPRKIRLSYSMMAPTETFQQKEYKYIYDTEVWHIHDDYSATLTHSMVSDRRLSIEEAEDAWMKQLTDLEDLYEFPGDFRPLSTTLQVVYRKLPVKATLPEPSWIEPEPFGPEWV